MPFDFNPQDVVNHNDSAMERLERQAQGNLSSHVFEEMKLTAKACKKSEALPESLDFDTASIYSTAFDKALPEPSPPPDPPRYGRTQFDARNKEDGSRTYHESISMPGHSYLEHNELKADGSYTSEKEERHGPVDYTNIRDERKSDGSSRYDASDKHWLGALSAEVHRESNADGTYDHQKELGMLGFLNNTRSAKRADGSTLEYHYQETPLGLFSNLEREETSGDGSSTNTDRKRFLGNTVEKTERIDANGQKTTTTSYEAPLGLWKDSKEYSEPKDQDHSSGDGSATAGLF